MTIDQIVDKALSRRTFLAGAGSAAAAALVTGCSDNGSVTLPASSAPLTDNDVLNFALNLEYLEAEFYLYAATGKGLAVADIGAGTSTTGTGAGTTTGGTKITFAANASGLSAVTQQNICNELAYTEQQHVRALRAALGANAVARPNLDIVNSFNAAAAAAGIGPAFNPYVNFDSFMVGVFVFEDVGVTAYNGAAPLLTVAGNLSAAAGILAIEAYHGALARTYLTGQAINLGTAAYPYLTYANQIVQLRSNLSGGSSTTLAAEQKLVVPTGTVPTTATTIVSPSTVVPVDSNALAFYRSTDQVLHVVYGTFSNTAGVTTPQAGVAKGGFFPNGLNGNITVTAS